MRELSRRCLLQLAVCVLLLGASSLGCKSTANQPLTPQVSSQLLQLDNARAEAYTYVRALRSTTADAAKVAQMKSRYMDDKLAVDAYLNALDLQLKTSPIDSLGRGLDGAVATVATRHTAFVATARTAVGYTRGISESALLSLPALVSLLDSGRKARAEARAADDARVREEIGAIVISMRWKDFDAIEKP